MDLYSQRIVQQKEPPRIAPTSTTALPSTIYEPKGKLFILDGSAKNPPVVTPNDLEQMCLDTKATLLHPIIDETKDEVIFYAMQSESHLLGRYNKNTKKMIVDDFTCGNTANPGMISPMLNPRTRDIFNLSKHRERTFKRGHDVLNGHGKSTIGNHLLFDIYSCCGDRINDDRKIRDAMYAALGNGVRIRNEIFHPFLDTQENLDGWSVVGMSDEIFSAHTYPKDKVIMGDISALNMRDFSSTIATLQKAFNGTKIDYRVLHRNYKNQ